MNCLNLFGLQLEADSNEIYRLNNIPVKTVSNWTFILKIWGIIAYIADIGLDWNLVIQYYIFGRVSEFWWTLIFLIIPSLAIAAITITMYSQDNQKHPVMKCKCLWIVVLVLQLSPMLRACDSLIYAIKSRRAESKGDEEAQRLNYHLMIREDSDSALLSVVHSFLEASPQMVLQMTLLIQLGQDFQDLTVLQMVFITFSLGNLGLTLAVYQRAIRYTQEYKCNMDWIGTTLQFIWHVLVILSRIVSISMLANVVGHWSTLACVIHIAFMGTYIQIYDRPDLYEGNKLAEIAFSFVLGGIYLFEFIATSDGSNRDRYIGFYSLFFIENFVCACLWYVYADDVIRSSMYFYPVLACSVVPFCIGILVMLVYYALFHPNVRKGRDPAVKVDIRLIDYRNNNQEQL